MAVEQYDAIQTIGKHFRIARKEKGLSVREAAKLSGLSYAYISRFENGVHPNIRIVALIELANVLDIDVAEIFTKLK